MIVLYVLISVVILELGSLGGLGYILVKQSITRTIIRTKVEDTRFEQQQLEKQEITLNNQVFLVNLASVKHECHASNNDITCAVTNLSDRRVNICIQGLLTQKNAVGVRLYSLPMCTGSILPKTTASASVPWEQGKAGDICTPSKWEGIPNWDECNFNIFDYKVVP